MNRDTTDDIRCEGRTFMTKTREYLEDNIDEVETSSKNKYIGDMYRDINEFKKGYQPRSNLVKMRMVICLQIPTEF
jgi:hypothetical protein